MIFDEGKGLSTAGQQYDLTSRINVPRGQVDALRPLPNDWRHPKLFAFCGGLPPSTRFQARSNPRVQYLGLARISNGHFPLS
jgi:hypothetical protein